jgi:hypothetical protein
VAHITLLPAKLLPVAPSFLASSQHTRIQCHHLCRAKLDSNAALAEFCSDLEAAVIETIEAGKMTKV